MKKVLFYFKIHWHSIVKKKFTFLSLLTPSMRFIFSLHCWNLSWETLTRLWRSRWNEIPPVWIGRATEAPLTFCACAAFISAIVGRKDSLRERIWVQRRHEISTIFTIPRACNPTLRAGRPSSSDMTCDSVAGLCTINCVTMHIAHFYFSFAMLFSAFPLSAVQLACFSVASLFTVSSATFQVHFT